MWRSRFLKKAGEWVEWEPPRLFVVEEYVETLAVDNEDATETTMLSAPRQPRIINCFAGPSLLASLAVSRFADHQPYYRLEEILLGEIDEFVETLQRYDKEQRLKNLKIEPKRRE